MTRHPERTSRCHAGSRPAARRHAASWGLAAAAVWMSPVGAQGISVVGDVTPLGGVLSGTVPGVVNVGGGSNLSTPSTLQAQRTSLIGRGEPRGSRP